MMNARMAFPLLASIVLAALVLMFALPAFGQSGNIQINNADGSRTTSVSLSPAFPGILTHRIISQYAQALRQAVLVVPPGPLQSLLGQASVRVVFSAAQAARRQQMIYPVSLVADGVPPVISARSAAQDAGGIKVTWTTDEFADSTVVFGTQPGVYPQMRSDPLYVKSHVILLTGLAPGTYYYRVQSRDQSDNQAQSAEGSFTVSAVIPRAYLPLVLR